MEKMEIDMNAIDSAYLRNVYQGKKVFVTGHTGFKGSWLIKILEHFGATIKGYALAPENDSDLYNAVRGDQFCESDICDIRNKGRLIDSLTAFQPDFVFHLAAQPLVRLSYQIPSDTFQINAIGTANLLDGIRLMKSPCTIVLVTTDKVYHNYEWEYPYRETDRLGGYDPYSASKACAEILIDSYRNSFFNVEHYDDHGKGVAVARAGNVIGGGDWAKDRLLPDIARALTRREKIIVRNPGSVRPWQHVLEPLSGYLKLGAKLNEYPTGFSRAYNFGPSADDALSVVEMVKIAIEKWGSGSYEMANLIRQPHEAGLLRLDVSKAREELKWRPKWNAERAVSETINWYKAFDEDVAKGVEVLEKQIEVFFTTPC